ncbi:hypothetical protein [Alloactinosynnema sp. L-07]|uniref:hypothetical protein n=1 Tax=Alloactinosynnema sp. L-07 TaxID=1653480 RepID=UPI0018D3AB69|nr:hypothetical protein [Alloactinosynnema sp. L-07]
MAAFLDTIMVASTRRGYAIALGRMVRDFGADANVWLLNPDRVEGWFSPAWGACTAKAQHPVDRARLGVRVLAPGVARGDPLARLRTGPG